MVRLALYAYPEIFEDDPSLLGDDPNRERLIAMSVSSIAGFDPELARTLAVRHLADTQYGDTMLGAVEHFEALAHPPSLADARKELAAILDESNMMKRLPRLMLLVDRMASSDPASAARLIDEMPRSSRSMAVSTLLHQWSQNRSEGGGGLARGQGRSDCPARLADSGPGLGMAGSGGGERVRRHLDRNRPDRLPSRPRCGNGGDADRHDANVAIALPGRPGLCRSRARRGPATRAAGLSGRDVAYRELASRAASPFLRVGHPDAGHAGSRGGG